MNRFQELAKKALTWTGKKLLDGYIFFKEKGGCMMRNRLLYYLFGVTVVLLSYLVANGYFFEEQEKLFTIPSFFHPIEVKVSMLVWVVLFFVVLNSYMQVEPDEIGSLVFLGKALYNLSSGPHIVWVAFAKVIFGPRNRLQDEFPADSKYIYYGDGDTPEGKVDPFRITTGGKAKLEEGDDPLESRLTLNTSFFTAFRISDMTQFIKVIGYKEVFKGDEKRKENGKEKENTESTKGKPRLYADIGEAFRQLQDTAKRVLNQEFASRTPRLIIEEQAQIAELLSRKLDNLVKTPEDGQEAWGIDLEEVALTNIGLSHPLNQALRDIPKALLEAQKAITAGGAEARVLFLKGEQESMVKKLMLRAEAEGIASIAKRLKITDTKALSALLNAKFTESALGSVGENGKLVIVGGGGGVQNLLGLLEANK